MERKSMQAPLLRRPSPVEANTTTNGSNTTITDDDLQSSGSSSVTLAVVLSTMVALCSSLGSGCAVSTTA